MKGRNGVGVVGGGWLWENEERGGEERGREGGREKSKYIYI